jgi:hypothetical protein
VIKTDFSRINNTMTEAIKTMAATVRRNKSFFIQVDTVSPFSDIWYVKLRRAFKRDVEGVDSSIIWGLSLEFEEQL